jgi:8-oxo-dGTP pyrophosphatase MutT (NUDIX family)
MNLLDHIRRCNAHDLTRFVPWFIGAGRAGYVRPALAKRLRDFPDVFETGVAGLMLLPSLRTPSERTAALENVLAKLREDGIGSPQRLEPYAVIERVGGPPLMTIDRGAASAFGIISTGFHMNGTGGGGSAGLTMWIARRALTKMTFPGQLDNIVAGGQPAALSVAENVLKECQEEANIPAGLARLARPVSLISYTMEVEGGLRRHAMYVYDLELPARFQPHPFDGEVESFQLLPIDEVAEIVRSSLNGFKFNCNLVVIDFLIRHGLIYPDDPDYFALVTGLRGAIP